MLNFLFCLVMMQLKGDRDATSYECLEGNYQRLEKLRATSSTVVKVCLLRI